MLLSLADGISPTQQMHMNTKLLLILLIQQFKLNISLKSSKENTYFIERALVRDLKHFFYYLSKIKNLYNPFSIVAFCQARVNNIHQFTVCQ